MEDDKAKGMEAIRDYLKRTGNEGNILLNTPTGRYYLDLGKADDADNKGRKVTILRSLPSGKLFVMDVDIMASLLPDGKERFKVAIDDDKAIEAIMEYCKSL